MCARSPAWNIDAKCIRSDFAILFEAQRLMLSERIDAASAGLAVGYESPTQFNREYKRQFGAPPRRDMAQKRS